MAETPDFEAIAQNMVLAANAAIVKRALVAVWNARGAADIAKLDTDLTAMCGR